MDSSQPAELQDQVVVPEMSGRFLKVTVGDELEYRNLSHWLEQTGVEFKSFMLKQDRPIKVVIRGLPSNTEPEDIKMKSKRKIENGAEALKRSMTSPNYSGPELREHVSPPLLLRPPTPAPSKDAIVNAGLLKDLLTIIEDTPCIDKQVFCRAFKNSFPRSARHLRTWIKRMLYSKLTETWLEPGIDPQIANYRLFKDDRIEFPHTVTRGGTAIYCKNEIVHNRVPLPATPGIDATAVQIKIKNAPPLNIISAYIRKSAQSRFPSEDFKKNFNSGSNCIIAGDFNASHVDWHNVKNTRYGVSLRNLVSNLRGAKLVAPQTATHLQPRQRFGSIIDLAVFKHIPYNHSVRVLSDLSSDHYPVILEINLNTSLIKNPEQLSTNWSNFKFVLSKKPLPSTDLTSNENIELAISELNQNFSEAFVEASKPKFKNAPKIISPKLNPKFINATGSKNFGKDLGVLAFILNSVPSVVK
ncbi:RNA-directed DNA polymerase from mobile element jockey [Trichonephila clavipes]|nr:RNA-directed DNA polymerase from mobile element jockey [Trichonephila clavipes]